MTLGIVARAEGSIVCASDLAVSYGDNKFDSPIMKGVWKDDQFVLYAGDCWVAHECLWREGNILDTRKEVFNEFRDEFTKDGFPAEFLVVDPMADVILIAGSHEVFGPFESYACIGSGSDMGWALLDVLYKRIRNPSVSNVKAVLGEVFRTVGKRREGVSREWKSEIVEVRT